VPFDSSLVTWSCAGKISWVTFCGQWFPARKPPGSPHAYAAGSFDCPGGPSLRSPPLSMGLLRDRSPLRSFAQSHPCCGKAPDSPRSKTTRFSVPYLCTGGR
jgi:hypothetical protein